MFVSIAWTAFVMGLVGGPHCIAMCAAPCSAVVGGEAPSTTVLEKTDPTEQVLQWRPRKKYRQRLAAYHIGRLLGYATVGAAAAMAMQSLAWLTQQTMALRPAWTMLHVAVLAWGLMMMVQARQPVWVERAGRAVWTKVAPMVAAPGGVFVAGFLWALMPCGLLYSALLVAALSGGAAQGALSMALFALGSGLWLWAGPWAWLRLRERLNAKRASWGTRVAGFLLCGVASWALWMDLVYRPSMWCR